MKTNDPTVLREGLINDGFCVAGNILDPAMLRRLRQAVRDVVESGRLPDRSHFGSLIPCQYEDPVFADLVAWPKSMRLLEEMGFNDVRWMSFFLINKPPRSPALWWHQDWFLWDDPISAEPTPTQVFLSYYLEDTSQQLGCLRVIPGTHRRRHELHDKLMTHKEVRESHPDSLPADHVMLSDVPDAVDVPVKAGSLVIADARVLHSARANQTDRHRPMVLAWYVLDFGQLSAQLKQTFSLAHGRRNFGPSDWWAGEAGDKVRPLAIDPPDSSEALPRNRKPGRHLIVEH